MESQQRGPGEPSDALAKILRLLAEKSPRAILELARGSESSLTDFSAELDAARTAGFVAVTGKAPDEEVSLTPAGRELAARLEQV